MMTHDDHDENRFDPMIGVWRVWFIPSGRAIPWIQISVSGANMVVIGVRPGAGSWRMRALGQVVIFFQAGRLTL